MDAHTPEWLDREYNALASLADPKALFAGWGARSAAARATHAFHGDIAYGPSTAETLDVFPAAQPDAPVLVFIHGGFWRGSDKGLHSFLAPALVAQGAAVVLLNYGLCPALRIETICRQVAQAVAWVQGHIHAFNGDARRIVLAGHSAGAHLAAMLLGRGELLPHPSRALCISGLYELETIRQVPFLQADLALTPESARALSPILLPPPRQAVVYTVVGGSESSEFLRHNELLRTHWGPEVVPVCESIPGKQHFDVLEDLADPSTRLHALALRLLHSTSSSA